MARNKRFAVVARNKTIMKKGIIVGGKKLSFHGKSLLYVNSQDEADEINIRYGKKGNHSVGVQEDPRLEWHLDNDKQTDGHNRVIHHYFFGPSPTRAARNFWLRYERKKRKNGKKENASRSARTFQEHEKENQNQSSPKKR